MGFLSFLSGAMKPIASIIDQVHTSDEERETLRLEFFKLQTGLATQAMEYEKQLLDSQSSIIIAEAQGGSWIQQNWRPITMLTFLVLVVLDSFGVLASPLADEAWTLLQLGLGGYVVGRSVEKAIPSISAAVKR